MRALVPLLLLGVVLAGCSDDGGPKEPTAGDFDDLGIEATASTGILLGVVVDEAIRPVEGVDIAVTRPDGGELKDKTDAQGRFAFGGLPPGSYVIRATHPQFTPAQSSVDVVAGVEEPPVVRVLVTRLFSQAPYSELIKFDGYLACAYSFGVSSTCVNDYTRVTGEQCTPAGCYCAGGCLKDYNVSSAGGNVREYTSTVGPGWQVLVIEEAWEPTSDLGQSLGFTVSYFTRPNAGHWFGTVDGPNPLRIQFDVGDEHGSAQYGGDEPKLIPPEGTNELFVFFGAGDESLAINQGFQAFQASFYYGIPPDGWSIVNGDALPF